MNPTSQLYATYMLYNSIFIEQTLDQDIFSQEEQNSITNVAIFAYLGVSALLNSTEDMFLCQKHIKNDYPIKLQVTTLDTLQDIIALDNTIQEQLSFELPFFSKLGKNLYQQQQKLVSNYTISDPEEFFSITMFHFESLLLLDQYKYSIEKVLEEIEDHEYAKEISQILITIKT